ncbi:hypothetical protein P7C73_g6082, partial [Tremellales sp. Uapishka_1]
MSFTPLIIRAPSPSPDRSLLELDPYSPPLSASSTSVPPTSLETPTPTGISPTSIERKSFPHTADLLGPAGPSASGSGSQRTTPSPPSEPETVRAYPYPPPMMESVGRRREDRARYTAGDHRGFGRDERDTASLRTRTEVWAAAGREQRELVERTRASRAWVPVEPDRAAVARAEQLVNDRYAWRMAANGTNPYSFSRIPDPSSGARPSHAFWLGSGSGASPFSHRNASPAQELSVPVGRPSLWSRETDDDLRTFRSTLASMRPSEGDVNMEEDVPSTSTLPHLRHRHERITPPVRIPPSLPHSARSPSTVSARPHWMAPLPSPGIYTSPAGPSVPPPRASSARFGDIPAPSERSTRSPYLMERFSRLDAIRIGRANDDDRARRLNRPILPDPSTLTSSVRPVRTNSRIRTPPPDDGPGPGARDTSWGWVNLLGVGPPDVDRPERWAVETPTTERRAELLVERMTRHREADDVLGFPSFPSDVSEAQNRADRFRMRVRDPAALQASLRALSGGEPRGGFANASRSSFDHQWLESHYRQNVPPPMHRHMHTNPYASVLERVELTEGMEEACKRRVLMAVTKIVGGFGPDRQRRAERTIDKVVWGQMGTEADMERDDSCCVCHDDYEEETEVAVTPCKHMYHSHCLSTNNPANGERDRPPHDTPDIQAFLPPPLRPDELPIRPKPKAERRPRSSGWGLNPVVRGSDGERYRIKMADQPDWSKGLRGMATPVPDTPGDRWEPTKKLTFSAMAGLKALHAQDPETFTRGVLSERFGISEEAVRRILRSKFRGEAGSEDAGAGAESTGSKWDRNPATSEDKSPVPAIMRAFSETNRERGRKDSYGLGGGEEGVGTAMKPRRFGAISSKSMTEANKGPFNGARGARGALGHMLRSDVEREEKMEKIERRLSERERRLADEVESEREDWRVEEGYTSGQAARKGRRKKELGMDGVYPDP